MDLDYVNTVYSNHEVADAPFEETIGATNASFGRARSNACSKGYVAEAKIAGAHDLTRSPARRGSRSPRWPHLPDEQLRQVDKVTSEGTNVDNWEISASI